MLFIVKQEWQGNANGITNRQHCTTEEEDSDRAGITGQSLADNGTET